MGVCVPNFRSVSFFAWPGGVTQINTYTNTHINKGKYEYPRPAARLTWILIRIFGLPIFLYYHKFLHIIEKKRVF